MKLVQNFLLLFPAWSLVYILALAFPFPDRPAWGIGRAATPYAVGVRSLPVLTQNNAQLGVMVWYPAKRTGEQRAGFGRWIVRADKEAPPLEGIFPLVIISHDSVGNALSSHETASALAEQGFVVIAPTHTGDSLENAGAFYSAALAYHRPHQARMALAAVRSDPILGGRLDLQRIGLLGVGAGALTVLQLCGTDLDASAYTGYCARRNDDAALCSRWGREKLTSFGDDLREIKNRHGQSAFAPVLPGVKAVGLLTPGWLIFANQRHMAGLRLPVASLFAGQDELYPLPSQEGGQEFFPAPFLENLRYEIFDKADHYSLSMRCPPDLAQELPELCGALQGEELDEVCRKRDAFFVAFFQSVLGDPLPPAKKEQPKAVR